MSGLNPFINDRLKMEEGKLYVAFGDFRAPFDKVNRDILMGKL